MPRVVLTESQRDKEAVESLIKKHAGAMRLTMPMLAKRIGMPSGMKEFLRDLVTGFLVGLAAGAGIIIVLLVYCRMAGPLF